MKHIRDYQSALDYLYSFIDFSLTKDLRYSPEKFNLDRMYRFLDLLDNPQNKYNVIHVAGTKGKGSICAMVAGILSKAGYQTGFYSSPHMIEFTERIQIGNEHIKKEEVIKYCNELNGLIEQITNISTFEIVTGMAFKYFADKSVEFAVIEVGMGGRLDATNVVLPIVTAISSISIDHTQVLGDSLKKIAAEKAGIIKENVPVVLSPQQKSAEDVVEARAKVKNAKLIKVRESCTYQIKEASLNGQKVLFSFDTVETKMNHQAKTRKNLELFIPLIGDHQIENAATALLVTGELIEKGCEIPDYAILEGIKELKWQGRFEIISEFPIIIIDGAHNRDSFIKMRDTIRKYLTEKKIILLFGVSEDKQVKLMLQEIRSVVDELIITKSNHPRALEPAIIEIFARQLGFDYSIEPDISKAVMKMFDHAGKDEVIIASGSLFIAGAVKEIITKKVMLHG